MMKIKSLIVSLLLLLCAGTSAHAVTIAETDTVHIGAGSLTDGMRLYIEVGVKQDAVAFGLWMTAYPDKNSGESVMCNDTEITDNALWQLVATGETDAIYTGKPTYYLKNVNTGKYFGTSTTTSSIQPGDKRMVDGTDKAYAFCFLTAAEIKAKENVDIRTYGNNNAVFIHHSNADGTWFRICRFGGYTQVCYMSSSYYPTNVNWEAWRLYTPDIPNDVKAATGIAELKKYYESIVSNYDIMMTSNYDDNALDKTALQTAMKNALDALENTPSGENRYYTDLKQTLQTQYEKAPFVDSRMRWWPLTIDSLKNGSKLMLECGPTNYRNRYMRAYPSTSGQNAVMCDDQGKNQADVWQLEATGSTDPTYTDKPTYYLKDVTSGKYFGSTTDNTSIKQNEKCMVDDKTKAYAFCILTAADIKAKETDAKAKPKIMNAYGNSNAVFFHHSNADGTWLRLSRFGSYGYVYYISSSAYPYNLDWQSWNLYSGETNYNIAKELKTKLDSISTYIEENGIVGGTNPGYYSQSELDAINTSLASVQDMSSATRQEIRTAIDNVVSAAYDKVKALQPIAITEGKYRLTMSVANGETTNKLCAYATDDATSKLGWHKQGGTLAETFTLTQTDGGWYMLNNATNQYLGSKAADGTVSMTDDASYVQTFTLKNQGNGKIGWEWKSTLSTYPYIIDNSETTGESLQGYVYAKEVSDPLTLWQLEPVTTISDKTDFTAPDNAQSAVMTRKLYTGLNTVCLPFALTADMIPVSGAKLYTFKNSEGSSVNFDEASAVEAGQPCLVELPAGTETKEYAICIPAGTTYVTEPQSSDNVIGTFKNISFNGDNYYKLATVDGVDKFVRTTSASTLSAFRFGLILSSASASKGFTINLGGETTGISEATSEKADVEAAYGVDGVRLAAPRKGINIVKMSNGKTRKVLVK